MKDLLRVVKQVQKGIEKHRVELQKSEALTRYVLIDPILRALGWDTEDPEQVRPEFPTETGRPDYALMQEGKPQIMIEAKPLGTNLKDARRKGINYVVAEGVPFFICTDGDVWEVYDAFRRVPLDEKRIVEVHLSNEGFGEVSRKLLALWQPAAPQVKVAPPSVVQPVVQPPSPPPPGITLSELRAKVKCGDKPPQLVSFPDGHREAIKKWHGLLVAVAKWIAPKIRKSQIPIWTGPKNYLLNFEPVHSSGKSFGLPKRINDFWLETGYDTPYSVRHACRLLETIGVPPDEVRVEF